MTHPLRIVYAGTPEFAAPALERLAVGPDTVAAVYTQPDRPAGRGRQVRPSPVKVRAERYGLPVMQPASLRDSAAQVELAALAPDVMIVAAYGLLLPREVLDIPRLGCINIHASLLPRWRGAAPIQRAILAGDDETGVCIMEVTEGLDEGPVISCRRTLVTEWDTGGSLHDRLAELGAELLMDTLHPWARGDITAVAQQDATATYARKLNKSDADVSWGQTAEDLVRQVRAFNPWPVARSRLNGTELRFWRARALAGTASAAPGSVVACGADGVDVATGNGVLRVTELQTPGGRRQTAREFLNGHRVVVGDRLG